MNESKINCRLWQLGNGIQAILLSVTSQLDFNWTQFTSNKNSSLQLETVQYVLLQVNNCCHVLCEWRTEVKAMAT